MTSKIKVRTTLNIKIQDDVNSSFIHSLTRQLNMIEHQLIVSILLVVAICLLVMVSQRIKVAYPVMLVLGGIALSFIPGMPRLHINPDVIFLVFLPPILYEAAVESSSVILDQDVLAEGRRELLPFLLEQAVSTTNHRFGYIKGRSH